MARATRSREAEIACRLVALDESLTGLIHQPGAFATECLRQEEPRRPGHVECGRVELDELQVGHAGSGLEAHRNPIAGGDRGIRRLAKYLARAASGQQCPARGHLRHASVAIEKCRATAHSVRRGQRQRQRVAEDLHSRMRGHHLPEHVTDRSAGGVPHVQHAPHAVRGLTTERRLSLLVLVEGRTPLDQLANVARALANQHVNRLGETDAVAGRERIARVQVRRVVTRPSPQRCRLARTRCCSRADRPW